MRYTTVIDISDLPTVYRNQNVRLVYLHMCLKSGYHEDDRDICFLSLRRLAADVGLTISATRHALGVLSRAALIEKNGNAWRVRKFILATPIPARARSQKKAKEIEIRQYEQQQQEEREMREAEEKRRYQERVKKTGKSGFEQMLDNLRAAAAAGDVEAAARLRYWEKNYTKK